MLLHTSSTLKYTNPATRQIGFLDPLKFTPRPGAPQTLRLRRPTGDCITQLFAPGNANARSLLASIYVYFKILMRMFLYMTVLPGSWPCSAIVPLVNLRPGIFFGPAQSAGCVQSTICLPS